MHLFDHFAARGESIVELPYAAGFGKGTTYPFFLATLRKAVLKTSVLGTGEFIINAGLSDAWYQPATAGQGFLITVFPGIQQVFLAWFTFDTQRPPGDAGAILGEPGHRWLTAQGLYGGATANLPPLTVAACRLGRASRSG
jgi:hypothetical protein